MYQYKAKGSETKSHPLYLGNISKDFTLSNMKKAGLKGILIMILLILAIF